MRNFLKLIEEVIERQKENPQPKYEEVTATLQFTEEECEKMGAMIGFMLLWKWDRVIRIIKRKVGDDIIYILRLCRDGYKVEAQAGNVEKAKRRFIEKTLEIPIPDEIWEQLELLAKGKKIQMVA